MESTTKRKRIVKGYDYDFEYEEDVVLDKGKEKEKDTNKKLKSNEASNNTNSNKWYAFMRPQITDKPDNQPLAIEQKTPYHSPPQFQRQQPKVSREQQGSKQPLTVSTHQSPQKIYQDGKQDSPKQLPSQKELYTVHRQISTQDDKPKQLKKSKKQGSSVPPNTQGTANQGQGDVKLTKSQRRALKAQAEKDKWRKKHGIFGATSLGNVKAIKAEVANDPNCINSRDKKGWTPLLYAVHSRSNEAVDCVISKGAKGNSQTQDGFTALHMAAKLNLLPAVQQLQLQFPELASKRTKKGMLPIHIAVRHDRWVIVKVLAAHNVDILTSDNYTPLHIAALHGRRAILNELLDLGANPTTKAHGGITPLHSAVRSGDSKIVTTLVAFEGLVNSLTDSCWTPLHFAARFGFSELIDILIDNGANIESITLDERKAIHIAAAYGHTQALRALVHKARTSINAQTNKEGYAPLHFASLYGHTNAAETAIQFGANVDLQSHNGWTPIHLAAKYGHAEVMERLIKNGANINAETKEGYTPLHIVAFDFNRSDFVKLLARAGAHVNAVSCDGRTPLFYAAHWGHFNTVFELIDAGARVDWQDSFGETPLHAACQQGHETVVKHLSNVFHRTGASLFLKNERGETARDVAYRNGFTELVEILNSSSDS